MYDEDDDFAYDEMIDNYYSHYDYDKPEYWGPWTEAPWYSGQGDEQRTRQQLG